MVNCWEFMGCPRETRVKCPAYPKNGRDCWKMPSTKCGGGSLELASIAEKVSFCRNCEFYLKHIRANGDKALRPGDSVIDLPDSSRQVE